MRTKTRVCAVSVVPGQLSLPLTWRALTGDLAVTIYRLRHQCWAFSSPRAMAKSSSRNGAGEQRWRISVTKAGRFCLRIDRCPALADGAPRKDLFVSAGHLLYIGGFLCLQMILQMS